MILEVIACSVDDCLAISRAGANRIELVQSIEVGGVTPSFGLIQEAIKSSNLPIVVMVRPRGGDFIYSSSEKKVMLRDIEAISQLRPSAVITGSLNVDITLDAGFFRDAMSASEVPVVCHRCFDKVADPFAALESCVELGVSRILTSGQVPTALEGADTIHELVQRANGRIEILPGSGIRKHNAIEIARKTGCQQLHFSCWQKDSEIKQVDEAELRSFVKALGSSSLS